MRNFGLYFLAGAVLGAAVNFGAPLALADFALRPWAAAGAAAQELHIVPIQNVNRAGKADRLPAQISSQERRAPQAKDEKRPQKVLVGCDAAFSPLSATASRLNYASRCIS